MPPSHPSCAYLGPDGSYSSQAARHLLPLPSTRLIPCPTIAAVFAADTPYAVVPLENTIHGVVQETLACLLASSPSGRRWSARRTYDKPIQHALVVKRGTRIEDVRWVASHEQALGQCRGFLARTVPSAKVVAVSSTALAAHTLHALAYPDPDPGRDPDPVAVAPAPAPIPESVKDLPGAAICSVELAQSLSGLEIVRKSIQDVQDNHTRFMLLCRRDAAGDDADADPDADAASTCFYRIDDPRTLTALLGRPSTTLIALHSKAFPAPAPAPAPAPSRANGHSPWHPHDLHKVQAKYAEKYNKRYLVEVASPFVEDADLPGVTRL